jgi:hypothetical protein
MTEIIDRTRDDAMPRMMLALWLPQGECDAIKTATGIKFNPDDDEATIWRYARALVYSAMSTIELQGNPTEVEFRIYLRNRDLWETKTRIHADDEPEEILELLHELARETVRFYVDFAENAA